MSIADSVELEWIVRRLETENELLWGAIAMLARRTNLIYETIGYVYEMGDGKTAAWPPIPMNPQDSPEWALQLEGRKFRGLLREAMRKRDEARTTPLPKKRRKKHVQK